MIWYLEEGWGFPFIQFLVADTSSRFAILLHGFYKVHSENSQQDLWEKIKFGSLKPSLPGSHARHSSLWAGTAQASPGSGQEHLVSRV